jgi:hypothetical protein
LVHFVYIFMIQRFAMENLHLVSIAGSEQNPLD